MGKDAGSSQPTQQNVTTTSSNLPEYAKPYFENLLNRAQTQSYQTYTPYGYDRIAGFTPAQEQIQQNVMNMGAPGQIAQGSALTTAAGWGALQAADYDQGRFDVQQIGQPNLQNFQMGDPMQVQYNAQSAPQMGLAQTQYDPRLQQYQMGPVRDIVAGEYSAPQMDAAQTQWQANLERFQMAAPEQFTGVSAQRYMSPFVQNVMDVQKREAITDAQKAQLAQDLGSVRQGTYGGARQLLAATERERGLGQQLGDIQARGQQAAYESAQAQFERDRAAGMSAQQANLQAALGVQELGTQTGLQAALANLSNEQQGRVQNMAAQLQTQGMNAENAMRAALANQGVDVTRAQANQQANLAVQQLGTQTGLQAALANLSSAQQQQVQNQAAILQTQGMNAENAMRAALSNQQAGLTVGQQNLQSLLQTQGLGAQTGLAALQANQQQSLEAQRLAEQSRQFGAQNALSAFGQAGQFGQTLGNLGQLQQNMDLQRLQAQAASASEQRALEQQYLDQYYQDFLRQRDFSTEQLGYFSNILRGLPVSPSSTQTTYAPSPSTTSQVLGAGLGALGTYNTLRG